MACDSLISPATSFVLPERRRPLSNFSVWYGLTLLRAVLMPADLLPPAGLAPDLLRLFLTGFAVGGGFCCIRAIKGSLDFPLLRFSGVGVAPGARVGGADVISIVFNWKGESASIPPPAVSPDSMA